MADEATLTARLAEAEAALHTLMSGSQEVTVKYDGTETTYRSSSEPQLRRYIRELKSQLGIDVGSRRRRVIY